MFTANNPQTIRQMYANDEAWRIRQETHERYSVPQLDFASWALDCIEWRGDEVVLDLGCGPGRWYEAVQRRIPNGLYYGLDLHAGMLEHHPAGQTLTVGNAEQLPYADDTFDVVMANHMLYHVENVYGAIEEIRRVLKPDGIMMATTNSVHNMPELQVLLHRAVTLLVPPGTAQFQAPLPPSDLFTLETGTRVLSRYFYAVARYDLPSSLIFPTAEPVLAYLESGRAVREPQLPKGVYWNDVMVIVREQINRLLEHFGELVISKLIGVLIATDRGGFIRDYVDCRSGEGENSQVEG
ncbi:MAG: class I SAM-dependent methyltransferase [Chloroflexi bacterium]|nr:class I SAM-dependent methyltransferase [Chloroflexota bacterium]